MRQIVLLTSILLVAGAVAAQDARGEQHTCNNGKYQLGVFATPSIGSKVYAAYYWTSGTLENHYWGYNTGIYWGYEGQCGKWFDFGVDVSLSYGCVYLNRKKYKYGTEDTYTEHFPHMQMRLSPSLLYRVTPKLTLMAGIGKSYTSRPFEELEGMRKENKNNGRGLREGLYHYAVCFNASYDLSLGARYNLNEHFNVGCRLQYDFLVFPSSEFSNGTVTKSCGGLTLSCGYVF